MYKVILSQMNICCNIVLKLVGLELQLEENCLGKIQDCQGGNWLVGELFTIFIYGSVYLQPHHILRKNLYFVISNNITCLVNSCSAVMGQMIQ